MKKDKFGNTPQMTISVNRIFGNCVKCVLLTILIFSLFSCGTKNIIKSDYSPRITPKEMKIKEDLKELKNKSKFYILKFIDHRKSTDPYNTTSIDPYLIWEEKGHEYRLEKKTFSDYLFNSLVFDLQRVGMNVIPAQDNSIKLKEIISSKIPVPDDANFIVLITIVEYIPGFETEWSTVNTYYKYDYHLMVWDPNLSKMVFDDHIKGSLDGASKGRVEFYDMVEDLLNDQLTQINFKIAELLIKFSSN